MWRSTSMDSTATDGPVSVYCDGVGCHVLCLRHGIPVWQHIGTKYHCYKQAPSWYDLRCFKATLNPNKQTNKKWTSMGCAFSYWTMNVRVDLLDPDLDSDNFAQCKHSIRGLRILCRSWSMSIDIRELISTLAQEKVPQYIILPSYLCYIIIIYQK